DRPPILNHATAPPVTIRDRFPPDRATCWRGRYTPPGWWSGGALPVQPDVLRSFRPGAGARACLNGADCLARGDWPRRRGQEERQAPAPKEAEVDPAGRRPSSPAGASIRVACRSQGFEVRPATAQGPHPVPAAAAEPRPAIPARRAAPRQVQVDRLPGIARGS